MIILCGIKRNILRKFQMPRGNRTCLQKEAIMGIEWILQQYWKEVSDSGGCRLECCKNETLSINSIAIHCA